MNQIKDMEWPFISSAEFLEVYPSLTIDEQIDFIRAYLVEGIPYIFRYQPISYETLRTQISNMMQIPERDICLVGSSKLGYSLIPKKFGTKVRYNSDFDMLIVAEDIFNNLILDYKSWLYDMYNGKIQPANIYELRIWLENIQLIDESILWGYINHWFIPYDTRYTSTSALYWSLSQILKSNANIIKGRKVTFRIYKNWKSLIQNLNHSLKYLIS